MNRVKPGGYSALIEAAYAVVPVELHRWIRPDFLCGTDPVFAGLHGFATTADGRSYDSTAHVTYPVHQLHMPRSRRRTTVVLPAVTTRVDARRALQTAVHELGHVLHESLAFEHVADPVTRYAQTNQHEAFAEAFRSWLFPGHALRPAAGTIAYFDGLVG